ncbi:nicotinate (nicotinamide) nucleotide adenylyltransferase [Tannerella sp. oral taxon 808]|nr:nicotinate (nicotinamide) nucleotide adenylyltransferase [Tannerella sp. oral taxon 808]
MTRVGIFSGSFNPIHVGHLMLANWMCEYGGVDELWFVVTPRNPLKAQSVLLDDAFRLALTRVATADYPRFRVSDVEFGLPRPSYTIRTLRTLREAHPDCRFSLVIGADSWADMGRWRDAEALRREFPLVVYPRRGYPIVIAGDGTADVRAVEAPMVEVSSTFIRRAIREGRDVRFFLPEVVRLQLPELRRRLEGMDE